MVAKAELRLLSWVCVCFHWVSGARSAFAKAVIRLCQSIPEARPERARLEPLLLVVAINHVLEFAPLFEALPDFSALSPHSQSSDGALAPSECVYPNIFTKAALYPNSLRAVWGSAFAWANIAVPVWTRMLYFAYLVLSWATSTSMMRLLAAERLFFNVPS